MPSKWVKQRLMVWYPKKGEWDWQLSNADGYTSIYKPELRMLDDSAKVEHNNSNQKFTGHIISSPKGFQGKYFTIIGIKPFKRYVRISLIDEKKDTLYLERRKIDLREKAYPQFILVPYYEKQKQLHEGKTFIVQLKSSKPPKLVDINTGKLVKIANGDEWQGTSLEFLKTRNSYLQLYLILKNKNGEEIKVRPKNQRWFSMENSFVEKNKWLYLQEQKRLSELERKKRREQELQEVKDMIKKRKAAMVKKYGAYYGNMIGGGKVVLGMTKTMCQDAWGIPSHVNSTIVLGTVHEQWVYSGSYLYFDNGKLTGIQK